MKIEMISKAVICATSPLMYSGKPGVKFREVTTLQHDCSSLIFYHILSFMTIPRFPYKSDIRFTTWDDYAIMSMVEAGLGISILPSLVLQRIPYHIVIKSLEMPAYRKIGIAMPDKKGSSKAVKEFIKYLDRL